MTTEELLTLHEDTSAKCREIMRRKNNDYTGGQATDDPFANFNMSSSFGVHPALGVVLRIGDKLQRIRSFANDGALQVSGETIDDACEDIVNYAIIIKGIFRAQAAAAQHTAEPLRGGWRNAYAASLDAPDPCVAVVPEASTEPPATQYRPLEEGEIIQKGDEYKSVYTGKWEPREEAVGQVFVPSFFAPTRRPLHV